MLRNGDRMLFSAVGENDRWHVYEMNTQTKGLKRLTPVEHNDVDWFDACYLPDGRMILASTSWVSNLAAILERDVTYRL